MTTVDPVPSATHLRAEPVGPPIPPSSEPRGLTRAFIARVLLTIALVIAWSLLYLLVLSRLDEAHSQRGLYAQLRTELAQGITPISAPIAGGTPVALINAPGAGIHNSVVIEGTSSQDLQNGPGHLRSTVLPGQPGTSTVLGRALSYGAPFGGLDSLRTGDEITVTTGQGEFKFRVTDQRRTGDVIPALPVGSSRLELATASGSGSFGALSTGDVLYVDADLVGTPARRQLRSHPRRRLPLQRPRWPSTPPRSPSPSSSSRRAVAHRRGPGDSRGRTRGGHHGRCGSSDCRSRSRRSGLQRRWQRECCPISCKSDS